MLHVHDLVDFVSEEGGRTGRFVARHLDGCAPRRQFAVEAGQNIRYVVPAKADPATENRFYMRPMIVKNEATLEIKINNTTVRTLRKTHIQPSEMICVTLAPEDLARWGGASEPTLQFSLA